MKILLAHSRVSCHWSKPWIYIGHSYLQMNKWNQKLEGERISLSNNLRDEIKKHQQLFLNWIDHQRKCNNDSLYWWMTHLSGRNNQVSKFFLYILQISALKMWIKKNNDSELSILIVCEDGFVLKSLRDNFKHIHSIKLKFGCEYGFFRDIVYFLFKALYVLLSDIYLFWKYHRYAKKSRPSDLTIPSGEVHLIHQCLDDKALMNEGPLSCRYFTILPEWLENQGKQVVRLPWISSSVNLPINEIFDKLRKSNCLIPEDWIGVNDYFSSIFNSIRSSFTLSTRINYPGINIKYLILRESFLQIGEGGSVFWRYIPMMKKWTKNLKSIVTFDHFENMIFEHVIIRISKKIVPKAISVGYYHSLVSNNFLGYHFIDNEWKSKVMPDRVVTNGIIATNILIQQGVPRNRLIDGPGLRMIHHFSENITEKKGNDLLVLLSMVRESNIELLTNLYNHTTWINENLKIIVRVKPHPFMNVDKLLRLMKWNHLPSNWVWDLQEINQSLKNAHCCITMDSSSAFDAIIKGCSVVPLQSEFNITDNHLDIFNNKFSVTNSVPSKHITQRLEEIFITKKHFFDSEFSKLKVLLEEGLNPVNERLMKVFLPLNSINKTVNQNSLIK